MSADPLKIKAAEFLSAFAGVVDISAVFVGSDDPQFKAVLKALADSKDPENLLLTSTDSAMVQLRERAFVAAGLYDDQIASIISKQFEAEGMFGAGKPRRRLCDPDPALKPVIVRRDGSKLER